MCKPISSDSCNAYNSLKTPINTIPYFKSAYLHHYFFQIPEAGITRTCIAPRATKTVNNVIPCGGLNPVFTLSSVICFLSAAFQ